MPTGIYLHKKGIQSNNFRKHWKVKNTSNHKGGTTGKHWKVKDTSKMSEARKGNKNCLGKHWKVKDTSKMSLVVQKRYASGEKFGFQKGHKLNLGKHWKVKKYHPNSGFRKGHKDLGSIRSHKIQGQKIRILRLNEISTGTGSWAIYKNTKTEQLYEQILRDRGFKEQIDYIKQPVIKNITVADFYLISTNTYIFIDGCY